MYNTNILELLAAAKFLSRLMNMVSRIIKLYYSICDGPRYSEDSVFRIEIDLYPMNVSHLHGFVTIIPATFRPSRQGSLTNY